MCCRGSNNSKIVTIQRDAPSHFAPPPDLIVLPHYLGPGGY
jgi:hypothetical protein